MKNASYPLPDLNEQSQARTALRKQKKGRKIALLKAENQLLKLRDRLKAVGYQSGDEVFERLQTTIFAVRDDAHTLIKGGV